MVPDWPGRMVAGFSEALVPGGRPFTVNATKYVGAAVELNPVENRSSPSLLSVPAPPKTMGRQNRKMAGLPFAQ